MEDSMNQYKTVDHNGIIAALAELPPDALIDEAALARIFNRHPVSIKRAIRRRELPPSVRLLGRQTWTAKVVLDHLTARLEQAKTDVDRLQRRISQFSVRLSEMRKVAYGCGKEEDYTHG